MTAGQQSAMSHSMGDLLSFPRQAAYQDVAQSGAILNQRVAEMSFYHNQLLDRGFPRIDLEEYYFARQDPFSVSRRGACSTVCPVDEREYARRPSTPTISPMCHSKPRMPLICPVISITSDNAESSVIYQDESDESDDRIAEEDEGSLEQNEIAKSKLNYSSDSFNSFERITTPPKEYATPAKDYKNSPNLLAKPLTFNRNFFDNIPYIDQSDDVNLAGTSECTRGKSDNSNLGNSEKCAHAHSTNRQILNAGKSNFESEDTHGYLNSSSINTRLLSANKSTLSVEDATIESYCIKESRPNRFSRPQNANNSAECNTLNVDEQYEDKLDNVSNSEDCANESSSTINEDCTSGRIDLERDTEGGIGISTPKMYTIMPELHLDLSGLNSDVSSDESKTEKCWKSPEEVRLGCGRVAALAKHFSKLGDAGLIRFKSTKLTDSRQFLSEPDIMTSEEGSKQLCVPRYAKEYKSDSDLVRETNDDRRVVDSVARRNIILLDVETNGDFAIEECKLGHCGAKRITVAKIPSLNDNTEQQTNNNVEKSLSLAIDEDYNVDIIKGASKNLLGTENNATCAKIKDDDVAIDNKSHITVDVANCKKTSTKDVSVYKDSSSKLSLEEQRAIVEQLEQFSNLDNSDAPLFIPEPSIQVPLAASTNNEMSACSDFTRLALTNQEEISSRRRRRRSLNTDNNLQRVKQDTTESSAFSFSQPSVHSPSPSRSSVVPSLSNVANRPLSTDDNRSQLQHRLKNSKSYFFIDISSTKNRSNDSCLENLSKLPSTNACTTQPTDKFNIMRVRIARPICSSEDNLIDAAIYEKKRVKEARRYGFGKLTRSCDSILNDKFLPDFTNQTQPTEIGRKDINSPHEFRDKLKSKFKDKTRWHRHRSLEELKLRKGLKKKDSVHVPSNQNAQVRRRFSKFCDKLNVENREETRNCRSLEELRSYERDSLINSPSKTPTFDIGKSDWIPPKRLCTKHTNYNRSRGSAIELSRENETKDMEQNEWRFERKSQSELDISRQKSESEREGWSFREIGTLRYDGQSALRKLPHTTCYAY